MIDRRMKGDIAMISDDEARKLAEEVLEFGSIDAEYQQQIARKLIELLDRQRWIPIAEKIPPTDVELDVLVARFGQGIDVYNGTGSWSNFEPETVTHWRLPLPQPPEQQT